MLEKEVAIDTEIFKEITDNIALKGTDCDLDRTVIEYMENTRGTDIGCKLYSYLENLCECSEWHKTHVSETLPTALTNLKDSLVKADIIAAESLSIMESRLVNCMSTEKISVDRYDSIKKQYGLSKSDIEYLNKHYPGLVDSLYGANKYSSNDAEKIYRQIKLKKYHCSNKGIEFIKRFEHYEKYTYNNGATIGYGFDMANYPDVEINYDSDGGISEEEATRLLKIVIKKESERLNKFLVDNNIDLSQKQYDVAMDIIYNRNFNDVTKEVIVAMGKEDDNEVKKLLDDLDYNFACKYIFNESPNREDEAKHWVKMHSGFKARRKEEYELYLQGKRN